MLSRTISVAEKGFRAYNDVFIFTSAIKNMALTFAQTREYYLKTKKGSFLEFIFLKYLSYAANSFEEYKIVYRYLSGKKNCSFWREKVLQSLKTKASTFDQWYYLFMISERDYQEIALSEMVFLAEDFYELRCAYTNIGTFKNIQESWKKVIEGRIVEFYKKDARQEYYNSCYGMDIQRKMKIKPI